MYLLTVLLPLIYVSLVAAISTPLYPRSDNDNSNNNINGNPKPTPTFPFTLAAFQSPWAPGSNAPGSYGVSGVRVRAFGGSLWVNPQDQKPKTGCAGLKGSKCPPGNETVLWVDEKGGAWMVG
jgi:hypothetical protein